MRTTIDIDDRLLSAARALASADQISLGRAVSLLIERGLRSSTVPESRRNGFPVIIGPPDQVITDELVEDHRDD